mmetsp:Transcript_110617/g.312826  ORF Transcript_110617/g.312826 Transcript_110617/m.312826 type:complete len:313 (-) Transcript_110617:129-1067(-)
MAKFNAALCYLSALCFAPAESVQVERSSFLGRFGLGEADDEHPTKFDCKALPALCRRPFNCHKAGVNKSTFATTRGHADYHNWCKTPAYFHAAVECQRGNLTGYGELMHRAQWSTGVTEVDAHYCFSFGHCDDFQVTPRTSLSTAERICDEKFGRDVWTKQTSLRAGVLELRSSLWGSGFMSKKAEHSLAQMACGMGNYHCDVIYCQQHYCSKPEYRIKYGSDRPAAMKKLHGTSYPPGHNGATRRVALRAVHARSRGGKGRASKGGRSGRRGSERWRLELARAEDCDGCGEVTDLAAAAGPGTARPPMASA